MQVERSGRRTDKGTWQTMAAYLGLPLQKHPHKTQGEVQEHAGQGAPGDGYQALMQRLAHYFKAALK
ncbi:hypothetical protein TNCV_3837491 [Trichonephila clavipes]|nr:hypothetical protein TNCV_3837491 [Trichonephila clavipes]